MGFTACIVYASRKFEALGLKWKPIGCDQGSGVSVLKVHHLSGSFRKLGVPYLGVLIIRILLFRVLYSGPLFSETPI